MMGKMRKNLEIKRNRRLRLPLIRSLQIFYVGATLNCLAPSWLLRQSRGINAHAHFYIKNIPGLVNLIEPSDQLLKGKVWG
jgi:hypothetical protein